MPELAGTVGTGSWSRDDPLEQLLRSSMSTAHRQLSPQSLCLEATDAWGLCFSNTRNAWKKPHCAPPARTCLATPGLLPGSGRCGFCHHVQGASGFPPPEWGRDRKPPASTWAGGFGQGSGEAEFIYTPLTTCFLTSAAPL